ncbi:MAG TPA: CinA family nicotinamide mononucleotide deamidase-related protein, partial [Ignavibacteriaceae bacterium]|nr:CinA family nicotinamide mononucleotide deamidase-related protein [Ignavibacteriaceae bacterium]
MKVHIVTIGDEILIGQTLNTNAAFIGSLLSENNITIAKTSVVGDVEEDIIQELDTCLGKNDIVISTGGLGPTNDDITRNSIVKYFNTELVLNEDVLRNIEERFKKINREVTPVNRDQAIVPANAKIITNNFGTAPGYWIEKNKKILIVLPGVPHEMKAMMNSYVLPSLKELLTYTDGITKKINLLTTGIGESTLYEKLGNIDELLSGAKIAFLPSPSGTKMRITAAGNDEESVNNKLIEVEQKIRALAGRYIFGKGEEELAGVVGRLLKERGLTVAVAESCTGG